MAFGVEIDRFGRALEEYDHQVLVLLPGSVVDVPADQDLAVQLGLEREFACLRFPLPGQELEGRPAVRSLSLPKRRSKQQDGH